MTSQRPFVAAALSGLLPGLGQLHNGESAKGIALLFTSAGLLGGLLLATVGPDSSRSWLSALLLAAVYPFLWLPAVLDAYQHAGGLPESILSNTPRWCVVIMLFAIGPMAVPLLWQSPGFSRGAKILWTIVVISIALAAVLLILAVGPVVASWLENNSALLEMSRQPWTS